MLSRDRKKQELKKIADSGNQRKVSFALAKKQRDEVRGNNMCTERLIPIFTNFY